MNDFKSTFVFMSGLPFYLLGRLLRIFIFAPFNGGFRQRNLLDKDRTFWEEL